MEVEAGQDRVISVDVCGVAVILAGGAGVPDVCGMYPVRSGGVFILTGADSTYNPVDELGLIERAVICAEKSVVNNAAGSPLVNTTVAVVPETVNEVKEVP